MIFVTLGSQKFPFDRLLQKLDQLIAEGIITEPVFAQTGYSTYTPRHFEFQAFLNRDVFSETMEKADTVITHAGTGAIIGAVKKGKKTIAVPRLAKYGEHVDDHQLQIVEQFADMGLLEPCRDVEELASAYQAAMKKTYPPYISNTHTILADIEAYLKKPMKLLVVSNMYPSKAYPSYGVFVHNFCCQLEELGIGYRLAAMHKGSNKLQKLTGYVKFYLKSFFCSLFGKYDAVYVHYASHSSPGVLLARKLRKFPIITNCHGSDVIPENPGQEKMQKNTRQILSLSQKTVVPSEYFRRVVTEKYGLPDSAVYVCASGGINTEIFSPGPAEETQAFTLGFVGRLSYGKGWQTFLQACAKLPDRNFRIVLVGDGPEKPQMLQMLTELDLQNNTTLHGLLSQPELAEIYRNIDTFVFPTERQGESLGLVAVEAMACGCPVIASDFAAPADYVVDGVNGYKFPMGNSDALAACIQKIRCLPTQELTALREGALATAQQYTRQRATQVLKKILLE